jgi:hypothetical protein
MSEDPQFYRDAITSRFMEALDNLGRDFPSVPPAVMADLKKRCAETLDSQFRDGLWGAVERHKLVAFIEQLLNRQGTKIPDLEAFYQQKAELDRRLFDRDSP